jgi:hypothetical protein
MEKAELILLLCEKILNIESQKPKRKDLVKEKRKLKSVLKFLYKYKTDAELHSLFFRGHLGADRNSSQIP